MVELSSYICYCRVGTLIADNITEKSSGPSRIGYYMYMAGQLDHVPHMVALAMYYMYGWIKVI